MRLLSLLLALALAACASSPPADGIPRVLVDGEWRIQGHTHGDAVLHLGCPGVGPDGRQLPGGCAAEFRLGVDGRLNEIVQAQRARAAQPAPSSVAPASSPSSTKEAPR